MYIQYKIEISVWVFIYLADVAIMIRRNVAGNNLVTRSISELKFNGNIKETNKDMWSAERLSMYGLSFAHLRGSVYKPNVDGRTDSGQRPILKPHLSNQCSNTRKTGPPPGSHVY
ncbi:hypothetical protein DPMN_029202 [Dreissena polymorpha]|uniref:Uncharacterized protein n=1 Tax=Dreissena polymorpha TaxID=45954 RepID=A0A9D4RGW3_DREPO|nr:hypothetical protein DPMN_029202 [Dreissena polymorpha]